MIRLTPRSAFMMLSCGAVIVLFELLIYMEKKTALDFLIKRDNNVVQFHGKTMPGEHVNYTNQRRSMTQDSREVVIEMHVESNLDVSNQTEKQDMNTDALLDKQGTPDRLVDRSHRRNQLNETVLSVDSHQTDLTNRRVFKWNYDYDQTLNNTEQYRSSIYSTFYRHRTNHYVVNCSAVIHHDKSELAKAKEIMRHTPKLRIHVERYAQIVDCERFRSGRGYIEHPLSQIELNFPLAFGILVYRDVEQAERLLRSIYRPHNVYCIHVDRKMTSVQRAAMVNIAGCLHNVFVSDTSINVKWGTFSVLEAELVCMKTLQQYKRWNYYINLTGQEFPLKTNKDIVSILKSQQGANLVDGTYLRARAKYFHRWKEARRPPHNIRPIKGSVHVAVNRQFVDFALDDYRSHDFLKWLNKTKIPDETFFATLNHNPSLGINGSFIGEAEEYPLKPFFMRYKNWELGDSVYVRQCAGMFVRNICILGVGDLNQAYNDIGLFANKFHLYFEYLALDCLEEFLYEKTWSQYMKDEEMDTGYYEHLDYVKKRLIVTA